MPLNGCLDSLRLDADITLCDGSRAMLQEPLDKRNVVAVVFVNFGGVPLSEAVGADAFIAKIVTDELQLFLDGSGGNGKDSVLWGNAVSQAVILNVLSNDQGDGEDAPLAGLLLYNLQTESVSVLDNAAGTEIDDVRDT